VTGMATLMLALVPLLTAVLAMPVAHASVPALPDSQRLSPVRAALESVIAQADSGDLPADVLVTKVREGLAKGIPAEKILAAVRSLAEGLGKADRLVRASGRGKGSAALLRTMAEGEAAGVDLELTRTMTQSNASESHLVRAVDALTELTLRGYPRRQTAEVVKQVLLSDPMAVPRVVAGLEELRTTAGLSRIDAVDTLGRSLSGGAASLESALTLSLDTAPGRATGAAAKSNTHESARQENSATSRRFRERGGRR